MDDMIYMIDMQLSHTKNETYETRSVIFFWRFCLLPLLPLLRLVLSLQTYMVHLWHIIFLDAEEPTRRLGFVMKNGDLDQQIEG
jgi:hypothetical protein